MGYDITMWLKDRVGRLGRERIQILIIPLVSKV